MDKPLRASDTPFPVNVVAGETYYWCSCGQSRNQPFCDGSHKGSAFTPTAWTAEADGKAWFCGCKASAKTPLCDGSHSKR